eukprot:9369766-Karenia_brevis.AAC.1
MPGVPSSGCWKHLRQFRDHGFQQTNRALSHRTRVPHNQGKPQKDQFDRWLCMFGHFMNWPAWHVVAANRQQWKSYENDFLNCGSAAVLSLKFFGLDTLM